MLDNIILKEREIRCRGSRLLNICLVVRLFGKETLLGKMR